MSKLLYISTVTWNFYPWRHSEIVKWLSSYYDKIFYVEPLRFVWSEEIIRFKELWNNDAPKNLNFIIKKSKFKKGWIVLIYENILNIINFIKVHPDVVISNDIYSSIFLCIYCKIFKKKFIFDYMDDWEYINKWIYKILIKYFFSPIISNLSYKVFFTSINLKTKYWKTNWYFLPNWKYFSNNKINYENRFNSNKIVFISSLRDWYDYEIFKFLSVNLKNFDIYLYWDWDIWIKNSLIDFSNISNNFFYHGSIKSSDVKKNLNDSFCWIIPLKLTDLNNSVLPIKLVDFLELWMPILTTRTCEMLNLKKYFNLDIDYFDNYNDVINIINELKKSKEKYIKKSVELNNDWLFYFNYTNSIKKYFNIINDINND